MSFSKMLALIVFILLLSSTPFSALAAGGGDNSRGREADALNRYLHDITLLQDNPPFPSLWGNAAEKVGPKAGWDNLRPDRLPSPLDRRAVFLKAWFRSPDVKLTVEGLAPALSAFPDLAPLLLWHLSQSDGVSPSDRKILGRLAAGKENDLFAPSARPEGNDGQARDLYSQAMNLTGNERDDILGQLVSDHPLSPESGLALVELGSSKINGNILIPRWVYLQKMGANDLVLRETKAYLATSPPFPFQDRALYLEARSLAILGHVKAARSLIREALEDTHRPILRSEFSTLRCRIILSSDFPRGVGCVKKLFTEYPHAAFLSSFVAMALRQDLVHPLPELPQWWRVPRSLWGDTNARVSVWLFGLDEAVRGEDDHALATWKPLARWLESNPSEAAPLLPRVLYFMAREESRLDHTGRAQSLYRQVLRKGGGTPYALWAAIGCRNACGRFRLTVHQPTRESRPPYPLRRAMEELFQMGLFGPALVLERIYQNPEMDRKQIRRYGDLDLAVSARKRLILVDRIFPAHGTGFRLPSGEWMSASILSGFRESGVPTLWALSIARQESRFRERSLSIDGAMGVMQLMPRTALAVADKSDPSLRRFVGHNLGAVRHPDLNSLIGGLYLKRLFDSVPGHPERAIAGYNAGLHAVLSWKTLAKADWDYFTEAIPFQETRRYVREVLWNYAYLQKHLEGQGSAR